AYISVHDLGSVALRIDGDEIGAQVLALVAELLQPAVEFEERRRAHFRAMGEAEEDSAWMATEGGFGNRRALLVDESERRPIGFGTRRPAVPVEGEKADACGHQDQNADENAAHHV